MKKRWVPAQFTASAAVNHTGTSLSAQEVIDLRERYAEDLCRCGDKRRDHYAPDGSTGRCLVCARCSVYGRAKK